MSATGLVPSLLWRVNRVLMRRKREKKEGYANVLMAQTYI
jgi:hypothetical protein